MMYNNVPVWGWPGINKASRMPMQAPVGDDELVATYENESPDIPFYVEPFMGYRAWNVEQRDDGMFWLRSVTYSTWWPMQQELSASCQKGKCTDSPNQTNCQCGIYTVKAISDAKRWGDFSASAFRVIGRCKIWGRIFQYEKGFIVEYAYPETLWVPDDYSKLEDKAIPDAEPQEIAFMLEEGYKVIVEVGWPESE